MNDHMIPMNTVLTLVGNLLKDIAGEALEPSEFYLSCKGCTHNSEYKGDSACIYCMRNYQDKYERKENNE